ncbi:MAG: hypothetical protein V1848_00010 [Candidatus Magasanikbacteria bacterium]
MEDQTIVKKLSEDFTEFRDETRKRFNNQDEILDRLARLGLENSEKIGRIEEEFATKKDIRDIHNSLDEILGYVKKQDQEMTFSNVRMNRLEEKVENNTSDITKLKEVVGIA